MLLVSVKSRMLLKRQAPEIIASFPVQRLRSYLSYLFNGENIGFETKQGTFEAHSSATGRKSNASDRRAVVVQKTVFVA